VTGLPNSGGSYADSVVPSDLPVPVGGRRRDGISRSTWKSLRAIWLKAPFPAKRGKRDGTFQICLAFSIRASSLPSINRTLSF